MSVTEKVLELHSWLLQELLVTQREPLISLRSQVCFRFGPRSLLEPPQTRQVLPEYKFFDYVDFLAFQHPIQDLMAAIVSAHLGEDLFS